MFQKNKVKKLVGIDIQKNCIRYCTQKNGEFVYGELVINGTIFKDDKLRNPENLVAVFREIGKRLRLRSFGVIMAAMNSRLLIRQIPLNGMKTEKEIREHLYFELAESIPLPFENPIFDLLILEKSSTKEAKLLKAKKNKSAKKGQKPQAVVIERNRFAVNGKVPVIVTSEPILIELGDALIKAGQNLLGVECSSLAYTRMFHRQINWAENFVLVELDAGTANITFFEELVPTYVQYEDYNQANWKYLEKEKTVHAEFRESVELDALESLAITIDSIITYYLKEISPNCQLSRIYLVGGHPLLKKAATEIIQEQTALPIKTLLTKAEPNKKRIPDRFLLAAGLSMKEV